MNMIASTAALISTAEALPAQAAPISADSYPGTDVARLEYAVDLLRTRYICNGWKMDEAGAERALRHVRAGCPDDDVEWVAAVSFISGARP